MKYCEVALKPDERVVYDLRSLYLSYGYRHYKVGKFEEYDLYATNKTFLKSEGILTFTDTDGKLMALKPDVTLSIIKNIGDDDGTTHKFFYNENVYRTSASAVGFREIMQTGLECIGNIGAYETCEVLSLAYDSLKTISADSILAVSHMGFVSGLLEECKMDAAHQKEALAYIASKNTHALCEMASGMRIYKELTDALDFCARYYGELSSSLEQMEAFCFNQKMRDAYDELKSIALAIGDKSIYVDFSIVNDLNYYNGIIFKGYVDGIFDSVLSGGRYDSLVHKMGKKQGAIGFAVYLDLLERFYEDRSEYAADVLLIYKSCTDTSELIQVVGKIRREGNSVKVLSADDGQKYRKKMTVVCGEVKLLEEND